MTRLTPLLTSKKTLTVSYATPRETLLGTPETLPTSEPTDPQIAYTVQESDLPTFNCKPYSVIYLARLIVGGQFITAGTCYWRMTKNGQSVNNGSFSVSANYYYVIEAGFLDVKVGDVLGLKLWSSVSDSNWDRSAIEVHPSRIYPLKCKFYRNVDIVCVGSVTFQNFTASATGSSGYTYIYNGHSSISYSSNSTTGFTLSGIKIFGIVDPYGMIRTAFGDATVSNTVRNATSSSRPGVYRFPVPSQITFRGILLD